MKNISMEVKGDILTVKIDLSKDYGESASGKSITVATTGGNVDVPETDVKIGINAYKKNKAFKSDKK